MCLQVFSRSNLSRLDARTVRTFLLLVGLLFALMGHAVAQTPSPAPEQSASPEPSATPATGSPSGEAFDLSKLTPEQQAAIKAAIIKFSQNPVGNITLVPFQFNNNYGVGPYTRYQTVLNVQPVVPIWLNSNLTLIARTIFPIINQPSFAPPAVCASAYGCGSTFGIGDTQEELFLAPKTKPGALIWGAGPIFQFPTASPSVLGTGKWSVGPAVVGLIQPGRLVMGMLATQLWSFAGQVNRSNVNSGLIEPFINYNLRGNQFSLTTAPIATVNYTAPGNQKWTVPLGGGGSYTFKLGDQLMQLGVYYYTNVVRPVTSPQTTLRVVWNLLFPVRRGINVQKIIEENLNR